MQNFLQQPNQGGLPNFLLSYKHTCFKAKSLFFEKSPFSSFNASEYLETILLLKCKYRIDRGSLDIILSQNILSVAQTKTI